MADETEVQTSTRLFSEEVQQADQSPESKVVYEFTDGRTFEKEREDYDTWAE